MSDRAELFHAYEGARAQREQLSGQRIVLTSGCFDMLHTGHLLFLEEAALLGDHLVVGVNDDASVRSLKGPTRPVVAEVERVTLLRALRCVSSVFVFSGHVVDEWIRWIRPDVFVTNIESVRQYPTEQAAAVDIGADVHIVGRDPDGPSTSAYLRTMRKDPAP